MSDKQNAGLLQSSAVGCQGDWRIDADVFATKDCAPNAVSAPEEAPACPAAPRAPLRRSLFRL